MKTWERDYSKWVRYSLWDCVWWGLFKMINAKSLMWPCPRVRQTRMRLWIRKTDCGFIKIQWQLHLQPTIHIALYLVGEEREWKKKRNVIGYTYSRSWPLFWNFFFSGTLKYKCLVESCPDRFSSDEERKVGAC